MICKKICKYEMKKTKLLWANLSFKLDSKNLMALSQCCLSGTALSSSAFSWIILYRYINTLNVKYILLILNLTELEEISQSLI